MAAALLFAANGLTFATWASSIPRIVERLGLSPGAIALAVFVASLGSITVMPALGAAIERFGARGVALAGAATVPVLLPLFVEATSYPMLLVVGGLFGSALGAMEVGMNAYAVSAERAAGTSWISQMHGLWSAGNVLGSLLLVALIAARLPLPSLPSAFVVAVCVLVASRIGTDVRQAVVTTRDGAAVPSLVALGLIAACGLAVEGSMADWAALYARRDLHASATAAPLAYAAFAGAMMAARFCGDAVLLRFGRGVTLACSGALAAVALAIALAVSSPLAATIAFAFVGVGSANLAPVVFGAAARLGGAAGLAQVTGIGYSAFLAGPAALGATAQFFGLRAALALAVVCAAAVAIGARVPQLSAVLSD